MEIRGGTLRSFDSGSHRAAVEIDGSISQYLGDIAVARNIDASVMFTGRRVAICFLEPNNPDSAVVIAVW